MIWILVDMYVLWNVPLMLAWFGIPGDGFYSDAADGKDDDEEHPSIGGDDSHVVFTPHCVANVEWPHSWEKFLPGMPTYGTKSVWGQLLILSVYLSQYWMRFLATRHIKYIIGRSMINKPNKW